MQRPRQPRPPAATRRPRSIHRAVQVDLGQVLLRTVVLGLLFCGLLAVPFLLYFWVEVGSARARMEEVGEDLMELVSRMVQEQFGDALSDLRYLSLQGELQAFLAEDSPERRAALAREYLRFVSQKRVYDQVRVIGPDGLELVRVDYAGGRGEVVPPERLQDKSQRYYFTESVRLAPGQIYVSPLDLNVEHEVVEEPRKPMLRFATPLFDAGGRPRGVLVLNLLAQGLLGRVRSTAAAGPGEIWLLDPDGYWLVGPAPEDEWGFMYPDRKQRSFAVRYPESWRAMSASDHGVTMARDAWLRFQRVYPLRGDAAVPAGEGLAVPVATESYHWTVVSRLTNDALSLADGRLVPKLAASYGVAALLAFWAAWALSLVTLRGRALSQAMETVLDNVPVLISYVDAEQRYRFNNRAYRAMWGVSPAEAYGRAVREVLGEESYAAVRPHIERALSGQPVTYEARLDFRGAGRRDVTVSYVPDVGESGDVRGFFAVVSDVTAVKEGERRDREHLNELAHAGRLASVGEMATQVAHEVNQPLTAIAAYAAACLQTLGSGGDPPPALKGWLEAIEGEARRASDVIRRLRDFVRKGETHFGALDVNAVVHEVVGMVQGDARSRGVSLTLDLAPGLGPVRADRILVEQVLLNLLRNALDVLGETAPSRRHLNVSTRPAGGAVEVAVSDTGPGVPEAFRSQLFERFFTSKPGGLGMGLPISRSIVEAHGGSIRYHDHPEGGAVFRFQLPLAA